MMSYTTQETTYGRFDYVSSKMQPELNRIGTKNNIFYRSQDAIEDYNSFDWHKYKKEPDSYKPQSSQALAIDVFGCLKLSPIKNQLINLFFKNTSNSDWKMKFEYSDENLLNEKTSTQIDVVLESNKLVYLVECKFTETGGSCSQTNKLKSIGNLPQCNGNYEMQKNPHPDYNFESKCALTGKGIRYWEFIDKLFTYSSSNEYHPCPFKGSEYQWMRNICFTKAFSEHYNIKCKSIIFYYDSSDISPFFRKNQKNMEFGKITDKIKEEYKPECVGYLEFIGFCISFCKNNNQQKEQKVWEELLTWLNKKETQVINQQNK